MSYDYYVYFLTNKNKNVLYVGVTNDLIRRVYEHKSKLIKKCFSDKYNLEFLIHYEVFDDISEAIAREKQIKGWKRSKKNNLINEFNPEWNDLFPTLL